MKKITGKVVSLVLALALVVTSFSSSFAFASTKTLTGRITNTDKDKIYLVNGGSDTGLRSTDFGDWIQADLKTSNREDVNDVKVDAISHVSGEKLVSLYTDSTDDTKTYLKLKSSTADGVEVISVLFEGTWTNDNGDDYTVKARKDITVTVYDKDAPVFGDVSSPIPGKGLDDFSTFAKTRNYSRTLGIYMAEPTMSGTTITDAMANYTAIDLTTSKDSAVLSLDSDNNPLPAYQIAVSSGDDDLHLSNVSDSGPTTATVTATVGRSIRNALKTYNTTYQDANGKYNTNNYTEDASNTNITITLKKINDPTGSKFLPSDDSSDKYTLKTKIEKKVDVATALVNATELVASTSATPATVASPTNYLIQKSNGKSRLMGIADLSDNKGVLNVTDCNVVFSAQGASVKVDEDTNVKEISGKVKTLSIGDANIGSIDLDNGDVTLADGKVGKITTDNDIPTGGSGKVTINSGKAGDINTKDASPDGDVEITGGTVGQIDCHDTVTLKASDEDDAITTGAINATNVDAYSDEAKIDIKSITTAVDEGASVSDETVTLKGDLTTIGSMDFDNLDTTLALGDDDDEFIGTIPAPKNATNAKIQTQNEDTNVKVTGTVDVDTIDVDSDTAVAFDGAVTADTVSGDGSMTVGAGKLYVTGSASGTRLKLSDTKLVAGTVAFKAANDAVDVDDFNTYGFTVTKSEGTSVDTFKIATLSFAGIAMNKASATIAKGASETFTAAAYPGGTSIPTGYTMKWELNGGSSDVFTMTSTGATATIKVNSIDSTFASENKTTLKATLVDADGYDVDEDDFSAATVDVTASLTGDAKSDTNSALSVAKGASYTMKVTAATAPVVTTGSNGVFSVALVSKTGNDYLYKLTATGTVGAATGVYLNGNKIFVATVKAFAFTCDTTKDTTVKGAYTFKITAAATPTVSVGSAAFKLAFVSKTGNAYLYKITSAGAAGAKAGVYVNGAKAFVATVG